MALSIVEEAGLTDVGRQRHTNEDRYFEAAPLFAVADGMGGARAGEIASALAAGALNESGTRSGGEERVRELVQEANRRVHERASNDPATSGMGTTMTVALVEPSGDITFGHVGDSRAYVLRGDALEQLTDDHSLVAELVRRGQLSASDAEVHPQRSVITRALGTDPDVDVDAFTIHPEAGDIYLLCSDGLSDMVAGEAIEEVMLANRSDLDDTAKALVRAANRGGGDDNITAVLFEIVADDAPLPAEPDDETREYQTVPPDEEDTLHPEDGVPVITEVPSAVDTMVVSPSELEAAFVAQDSEVPQAGTREAGIGRRLLALLVIVALIALIVVLVWWGLAR